MRTIQMAQYRWPTSTPTRRVKLGRPRKRGCKTSDTLVVRTAWLRRKTRYECENDRPDLRLVHFLKPRFFGSDTFALSTPVNGDAPVGANVLTASNRSSHRSVQWCL